MKPLNMIKKMIFNIRFHKINKHYETDPVIGQRAKIEREGKAPVEVILYFPKEQKNAPVFVQIHGGAWGGLDAVDDDCYCQRLSEELGAFVVNVNYKRLYDKSFPYPQEEVVDTVKWLKKNVEQLGIDPDRRTIRNSAEPAYLR